MKGEWARPSWLAWVALIVWELLDARRRWAYELFCVRYHCSMIIKTLLPNYNRASEFYSPAIDPLKNSTIFFCLCYSFTLATHGHQYFFLMKHDYNSLIASKLLGSVNWRLFKIDIKNHCIIIDWQNHITTLALEETTSIAIFRLKIFEYLWMNGKKVDNEYYFMDWFDKYKSNN